jgi:hypothetical protein
VGAEVGFACAKRGILKMAKKVKIGIFDGKIQVNKFFLHLWAVVLREKEESSRENWGRNHNKNSILWVYAHPPLISEWREDGGICGEEMQ